ncbi:hypothetical protein [Alkalicoccobacillus porphyridii]|uniref:Uncharacterized protein n=1 Tax=Alkalicoccobacillus porphyridii TaxID=2597270 RepID=A0A553ZZU9_9BACI|nr:hypothetical protein [Alkalicoccobacillus porphyridii]TSB46961.1 hypothetical protein FN960_08040 [Alkalicoccobacillus porphyridii]
MWMKTSLLAIAVMLLTTVPLKAVQAASETAAESEPMGLFATVLAIFSFATLALMTFYAVRDNN